MFARIVIVIGLALGIAWVIFAASQPSAISAEAAASRAAAIAAYAANLHESAPKPKPKPKPDPDGEADKPETKLPVVCKNCKCGKLDCPCKDGECKKPAPQPAKTPAATNGGPCTGDSCSPSSYSRPRLFGRLRRG